MSFLVVALLSLLWLGFFLPSLLQARRTSSPYASATTFQDSLRRLGEVPYPRPPDGEGQPAPRGGASRAAAVAARRREILAVLAAAVVAGAAIAVSFRGWAVWAAVPPPVVLTAYVVMLRREVTRRRPHAVRTTRVAHPQAGADPALPEPVPAAPNDVDIVPSVARRSAVPPPERMAG